jgi:HD-GYP domain-containing protein (c-di-GMP phosphodiesterase class II)
MQEFNYQSLVKIGRSLISERNITKLCELILDEAQALTGADGGTLYLVDTTPATCLNFAIVHNISLNTRLIASPGESIFEPVPLFKDSNDTNQNHVAAFTAHAKTLINIDNAYDNTQFDFSGAKKFDQEQDYKTQSVLAVPLLNEMNQIIGMIQLINATDPVTKQVISFPKTVEPIIISLAMFAATALENRTVSDNQRELLIELAATTNTEEIIERILDEAISITHSEGGTLYLIEKQQGNDAALTFEIIKNDNLNIYMGGKEGTEIPFSAIPLLNSDGVSNEHNVAAFSANSVEVVNIPDVYQSKEFDFSGAREFDIQANYRTKSVLTLPLLNHQNEVIGVLQLINARHPDTDHIIPYSERFIPLLKGLALYAAIALNNQILVQDLKNLLDAFVRSIAKAIDAKSPHTSGHCQRVPLLMELMAEAACQDNGKYKDFQLNEEEWYELRVSAWMHDCGKLATPDSILEKSTKLHKMRDGIELVASRFSVLKHHKKIQYLELCINNSGNQETNKLNYLATISKLDEQFEFVEVSNKGGEFMSDESKARIVEIAEIKYPDFDGKMQNILNKDEIYNLCIERGTLTAEERQIINNHMVVTIDMLEELPFPKQLQRVPEYAGGHHEKMNGSGFPRGLTKDQMSIPARMMAIADIFEALTAKDRPYKDPMKISLSLNIMGRMVKDEHIDPDLFELFLRSRVWEKYAKSVLNPEQVDVTEIEPYLIAL